MKKTHLLALLLFLSFSAIAQTNLTTLSLPTNRGRYDDIFFVNDTVGWVCGGYEAGRISRIYHTRDGGQTWTEQFKVQKYLRSIEFANEKLGFCGSLDSTFFKTTDGGNTWTDITALIPKRPKGICGLAIPDANTIYGVGKFSSPAFVIKSTDAGLTWSYIDLSNFAKGLVDVFFFNKDEGFVTGIGYTGGVVLYTHDGGKNWEYKFNTGVNGDYIWKIQSPDNINFYASVESMPFTNNSRYLHSSDKGVTWQSVTWSNTYVRIQGIGFLNKNIGWLGGDDHLFKTIDGGTRWVQEQYNAPGFDRFHRVNAKIAFLSGVGVFKYNMMQSGNNGNTQPDNIHYLEVSPNPVRNILKINPVFQYRTHAMVMIYSSDGKLVADLYNGEVNEGSRTFSYDFSGTASGVYYVVMKTNEGMIYKKIARQ